MKKGEVETGKIHQLFLVRKGGPRNCPVPANVTKCMWFSVLRSLSHLRFNHQKQIIVDFFQRSLEKISRFHLMTHPGNFSSSNIQKNSLIDTTSVPSLLRMFF